MIVQIKEYKPDNDLTPEEVCERIFKHHPEVLEYKSIIVSAMKIFAKDCCQEQREICAKSIDVNLDDPYYGDECKEGIINSELPKQLKQ